MKLNKTNTPLTMRAAVAGILFLITITVSGCENKKAKIIGKWTDKDGYVEFFQDETFSLTANSQKDVAISGKWTILDDGRIKMDMQGGSRMFFAKLKDDGLVIMFGKEESPILHRVK